MSIEVATVLVLIALLQIKHLFADYFLQSERMLKNRSTYLHLGRMQHAAIHAALSILCLLVIGAPVLFVLVLCLIEGGVHFHIDWLKGLYSKQSGDTPEDASYWRAFGADQLLHMLTYIAMAWAWVVFASGS